MNRATITANDLIHNYEKIQPFEADNIIECGIVPKKVPLNSDLEAINDILYCVFDCCIIISAYWKNFLYRFIHIESFPPNIRLGLISR